MKSTADFKMFFLEGTELLFPDILFDTAIRRKMLISVKLLTKYVIKIHGLGSVHKKFGVWIKAVPNSLQKWNSRSG